MIARLFILAIALTAATSFADFRSDVRPLLEKYCFDCHGEETQKGQLRLDEFAEFEGDKLHTWTQIYGQLDSRQMPPEKKAQPTENERESIQKWITAQTAEHIEKQAATQRKLNRRELSAALKDLTGIPIDFGAGLPADSLTDGFDTGAAGLQDAADSVTQLLEVTRRAVESIRFLEPARDRILDIDFREHEFTDFHKWIEQRHKDEGIFTRSKRLTCKLGTGVYLPTEWSGDRGNSFLALPAPTDKRAAMTIKLRVASKRPMPGLPLPILWVKIGGKYVDYQQIGEKLQTLSYAVRMEDHLIEDGVIKLMLRSVVEMPYAVEGFENDDRSKPEDKIAGGIGVYRPKLDRKKLRTPEEQPVPSIVIESLQIDYDHHAQWPPLAWGTDIGEIADNDACARRLIGAWVERAWRRPVAEAEFLPFFGLYKKLRGEGFSFDDGLRASFQSVLMGGPFRYHAAPRSGQHALASRLSFMMIGAPPDDELRQLATQGKLNQPGVLDAQVDRLLDDQRCEHFFPPFVTQWLKLDQPITLAMSHLKKQDFRFGRHLKASLKEETIQYVRQLFTDNRPARELVSSDWTMLNDILAVHYGREAIGDANLRKVKLEPKPNDPRGGGILGHAGIQSMLCWMGANWVIYRGAWALDHILDDPPPPPPLEVPELLPSDGANRGKSFRELLVQHQADQRCATCHRKMDPLGFAFQNFDLSGRWREVEHHHYARKELDGKIEWRGEGETRPVDAVGRLPRGEEFSSYPEFRRLLVEHYIDDIVRGLLKKLTLYGTGHQAHALDLAEIRSIMDEQRDAGYALRDLMKALVRSQIFSESFN